MTRQRRYLVLASVLFLGCALIGAWCWWRVSTGMKEIAQTAPKEDEADRRAISLHVTDKNQVRFSHLEAVGDDEAFSNRAAFKIYMIRRFDEEMKRIPPEERVSGPRLRIEIHAETHADRDFVKQVLDACWEAGFTNIVVLKKT